MQDDYDQAVADILSDVHLPLENIAFALEDYMCRRGRELDGDTRTLLSGLRSAVGQVAKSARKISERDEMPGHTASHAPHALFAS